MPKPGTPLNHEVLASQGQQEEDESHFARSGPAPGRPLRSILRHDAGRFDLIANAVRFGEIPGLLRRAASANFCFDLLIAETMAQPMAMEPDPDDPELRHALRSIADFGYRVLRVIFNQTRTPPHVVTVFFDRTMKGKL